eukprot:4945907-Prymnesium_polylepis.1
MSEHLVGCSCTGAPGSHNHDRANAQTGLAASTFIATPWEAAQLSPWTVTHDASPQLRSPAPLTARRPSLYRFGCSGAL